jgi:uncharacterized protein (DUF2236 family)
MSEHHSRRPSDPWEAGRWLRQQIASAEDDGYFGPSSTIWRLHREAALGFGLGRALLLQVAHPSVAQAVVDHSTFRERPLDRLIGTVIAAELLVFGSRAQADATAAGLRRMHTQIAGVLRDDTGVWKAGTPYRAEDPDALLWVLVTLLDTTIRVYEVCLGRLDQDAVHAYLAEGAQLGAMLGVPEQRVPRDRRALAMYMKGMIDGGMVAVGSPARQIAVALRDTPVLPGPAWRIYSSVTQAVTVATMPPRLRAQYGTLLARRQRPHYRVLATLGRLALPRLPDRLRLDPIAALAVQRAARRAAGASHVASPPAPDAGAPAEPSGAQPSAGAG